MSARYVIRVLVTAVALVAAAVGCIWWAVWCSLPTVAGSQRLPGLSTPVTVVRDRSGVPHIFAASQPDSLRALGYVHAQDRRFQMELLRRAGAGRLAEVIGESGLAMDQMNRTLGLMRVAQAEAELLSPEDRALYDAYAEGVNEATDAGGAGRAIEFRILGLRPEPWTAADSLVIVKLYTLVLTSDEREWKTLTTGVLREVGEAAVHSYLPPYPDEWMPPVVDSDPRGAADGSAGLTKACAQPPDPAFPSRDDPRTPERRVAQGSFERLPTWFHGASAPTVGSNN